jgi:hypothetical protein
VRLYGIFDDWGMFGTLREDGRPQLINNDGVSRQALSEYMLGLGQYKTPILQNSRHEQRWGG